MRSAVVAIVPAAGFGKRLGLKTKKPFVKLAGTPLVFYALDALERSKAVDAIIIAAEKCCIKRFKGLVKAWGFKKVTAVVEGGETRTGSVKNCLTAAGPEYDIVLIHDGARPFVDAKMIADSVRLARMYGGCIVAVPENDTVKLAGKDLFVKNTLDRSRIFRAQTPQVFKRSILEKAYSKTLLSGITDDAGLVEAAGGRIKILAGSYRNIKITTKEDLKLAEVLL